jgi:hypothetical protein
MSGDRTVHAAYPGMEIVRYDLAGKWYLEPLDTRLKRQPVSLKEAVDSAAYGLGIAGGRWVRGRCGGRAFDHKLAQRIDSIGPLR